MTPSYELYRVRNLG